MSSKQKPRVRTWIPDRWRNGSGGYYVRVLVDGKGGWEAARPGGSGHGWWGYEKAFFLARSVS